MKDIAALRLYTRVARLGSFSAAARESGLSQSQASRIIADLETSLGARLLSRTTRAVVPTEAGHEFLLRLDPILAALEDAEQGLREGRDLRGNLRMSMPTSVGTREVIPRLRSFSELHPGLHVHVLLKDGRQDLVRESVDVAIRVGRLTDSTATLRLLTEIPRVVVAAPSYLEQMGCPATPADLAEHRIVRGTASAVPGAWTFERDGKTTTVDPQPRFSSDDNEGAVAACIAGMGITSTSLWSCRRELKHGLLVRLLADFTMSRIPVHAYYPSGRATRAAARAVVDHLAADIQQTPADVVSLPFAPG